VSWSQEEACLLPCLLGVAGEGEGGNMMVAMLRRRGGTGGLQRVWLIVERGMSNGME
jgi:hypothetical protein